MIGRFVRFNIVGALGFGVQVAVLMALDAAGVPVVLATLAAVETAVLHNFVWHERWTWSGTATGTMAGRLTRFQLSNGSISLVGTVTLTSVFAEAGLPLAVANLAAAVACMLANFTAAHLWVFCATTWPTFHGHLQ